MTKDLDHDPPHSGLVRSIWIASEAAAPMISIPAVRARAARGLEGDRYFLETGAFSRWPGPRRQLTLVAEESIQAASTASGTTLSPADLRRNVVTAGVDLDALVGREIQIGEVVLRGLQRALPCAYLERLSGRGDLRTLLREGRAGIRAEILTDGWIRVGDAVDGSQRRSA